MRSMKMSQNKLEYVFKDNHKRDLVLIFPGGGYFFTSPREGMPVARRLNDAGFHAAIYWYREEKLLYPLVEEEGISKLEELINDERVNKLYVLGFSAGAHYALMLSVERPDLIKKTVLAYPVVSNDPSFGHLDSFRNLLGTLESPYMNELSLEKRIHSHMNPVFIMHIADDDLVPVDNALVLANALKRNKVPFELHIYPHGDHGVSLANQDVTFDGMDPVEFEHKFGHLKVWFDLAITFLK